MGLPLFIHSQSYSITTGSCGPIQWSFQGHVSLVANQGYAYQFRPLDIVCHPQQIELIYESKPVPLRDVPNVQHAEKNYRKVYNPMGLDGDIVSDHFMQPVVMTTAAGMMRKIDWPIRVTFSRDQEPSYGSTFFKISQDQQPLSKE